jgi:4-amino-4-deoxy-L-arabinose transferase-like glycosyltransferase
MGRTVALGRALFFLVATAPIWALKQVPVVFHPVVLLFLTIALTLLFLWWDRRPVAMLGLDPAPGGGR